jgi:hypothetical protein
VEIWTAGRPPGLYPSGDQFGPLGSPPALLVALVVAVALWVLAGLGFETGVF